MMTEKQRALEQAASHTQQLEARMHATEATTESKVGQALETAASLRALLSEREEALVQADQERIARTQRLEEMRIREMADATTAAETRGADLDLRVAAARAAARSPQISGVGPVGGVRFAQEVERSMQTAQLQRSALNLTMAETTASATDFQQRQSLHASAFAATPAPAVGAESGLQSEIDALRQRILHRLQTSAAR